MVGSRLVDTINVASNKLLIFFAVKVSCRYKVYPHEEETTVICKEHLITVHVDNYKQTPSTLNPTHWREYMASVKKNLGCFHGFLHFLATGKPLTFRIWF